MKKFAGFFVWVAAVFAMAFAAAGCAGQNPAVNPDSYAFVTIDINPSVELITLGDSVAEVKAANYDACVLLEGEDFTSMTLEDAAEKIVCLAEQLGYLTDSNNQVKITVISDDMQAMEILKSAAKSGAEKGSKKAVAVSQARLQDELTLEKLKEEKPDTFSALTEEKVRLIEAVMEYDSTMTYERGAEMSIKELTDALKSAIKEDKEIITSELRNEYEERYAAAKYAIEREIASVYGEEYLSAWEKYGALESIYKEIEERLDKGGLSEEHIEAVMRLLEITDRSLIEKGGTVKAEYVHKYMQKYVYKTGAAIGQEVKSVLEILDLYDEDKYVLTEEELAAVYAAAGEEVEFTSLSEFDEDLSARKSQLNAIKKSVNLTRDQIEQIAELKERFENIKQEVLADMQELIASARERIAAEKQERAKGNI